MKDIRVNEYLNRIKIQDCNNDLEGLNILIEKGIEFKELPN